MDQYVALLKQFVGACNANTDLLHDPRLGFYREYLEKLGANIPPKTEKPKAAEPEKEPESASAQPQSEPEPTPEQTVPFPELDNSGVIEPDDGGALPMGDPSREPSEEDIEKASEERDKANEAFSNGDFDSSLQHYTTAIECNPGSAILHAKRANVLLKLKRPVAAIADCDKAISINPDSAQGYKFRGRANRLLGRWVEAKTDLATACKLDYDETANEWLKEVQPNAHKLQEYNRAVERQKAEKDLEERRERVRRAQEANRKAAEEAAQHQSEDDFDFSQFGGAPGAGGPGGPGAGGISDLFNDPEIAAALQDPEVLPALMDIMQNPGNIMKYLGNPKIAKFIEKMQKKGGGVPGMFGGAPGGARFGGAGGGCPSSGCTDSNCGPPGGAPPSAKAPEPDLD